MSLTDSSGKRVPTDDPRLDPIWAKAGELGIPVLGWYGHDLGKLGKLLDELPNVYTEIGAVLHELGRRPRAARAFLTKYQDRVLMGKDIWNPEEYPVYFRVLETDDEYFDYYRKRHAFWKMYGLALPDQVLKKIYYKNALKVIPAMDRSQFPD